MSETVLASTPITLVLVESLDDALCAVVEYSCLTCLDVRGVHVRRAETEAIVEAWPACAPEVPLVVLEPGRRGTSALEAYIEGLEAGGARCITVVTSELVEEAPADHGLRVRRQLARHPNVAVLAFQVFPAPVAALAAAP